MNSGRAVFDDIADYYDLTRREAKIEEIDAIAEILRDCKNLLEIGIGTGRIAKPLQDRGFRITGIDISKKMLEKAQDKGLENLVIGDARQLPFLDKSLDGTIIVHVFHLMEDRKKMMLEASRVTKKYVISLIDERHTDTSAANSGWQSILKIYSDVREKYGYPLMNQPRLAGMNSEWSILDEFAPYKKIKIGEFKREVRYEDPIERFEHSSRFVHLSREVPEDIHEKILNDVKQQIKYIKLHQTNYSYTEYLCVWKPEDIARNVT